MTKKMLSIRSTIHLVIVGVVVVVVVVVTVVAAIELVM
jgi:hypothetical protein